MNIILYENKSENIKIDKDIEELQTLEGNFRNEVDIINPTFDIIDNEHFVPTANYCYIPELGRYYFINNIVCYRQDVYTIECSVDVLETYKDEILEMYAIVTQDNNNQYYISNTGNYDVRKDKEVIYLENNFNPDGIMILTAINSNTV